MKFKKAESEGWFYKIDDNSKQSSSFSNRGEIGKQLFKEMQIWISKGNEVEPQYTPVELEEKKKNDLKNSLDAQRSICTQNLKDTDYKLLSDFGYPSDIPELLIIRKEWKRIKESDKIEPIPPKPFS